MTTTPTAAEMLRDVPDRWADPPSHMIGKLPKGGAQLDYMGHADITLAFGTEFISAHTGSDGQLVEGDPQAVRTVTDVWTFSRDTRARDPNWHLVATSGDLP